MLSEPWKNNGNNLESIKDLKAIYERFNDVELKRVKELEIETKHNIKEIEKYVDEKVEKLDLAELKVISKLEPLKYHHCLEISVYLFKGYFEYFEKKQFYDNKKTPTNIDSKMYTSIMDKDIWLPFVFSLKT